MDKSTIAIRIKALRAKAADSAASEAEAMSAADMAAKLLARYDLTEADLADDEQDSSAVAGGHQFAKTRLPDVLMTCWSGIQRLTETKCYRSGGSLRFIGMPQDVEMGIYLSEMLAGAAERMWQDYRRKHGITGGRSYTLAHRRGFMRGFGNRINERLFDLADARKAEVAAQVGKASGTAIVVRKQDLIKVKMAEMDLDLRKSTCRRAAGYDSSASAGFRAAGRVNLGRPVGGSHQHTVIR